MNPRPRLRLGILLVTLSALVWSTAGLFTRIIETDTPTMLLWRGIFGSLGFFAYMVFEEGTGAFGRLARMDRWGFLYALIGAAAMLMVQPVSQSIRASARCPARSWWMGSVLP